MHFVDVNKHDILLYRWFVAVGQKVVVFMPCLDRTEILTLSQGVLDDKFKKLVVITRSK